MWVKDKLVWTELGRGRWIDWLGRVERDQNGVLGNTLKLHVCYVTNQMVSMVIHLEKGARSRYYVHQVKVNV